MSEVRIFRDARRRPNKSTSHPSRLRQRFDVGFSESSSGAFFLRKRGKSRRYSIGHHLVLDLRLSIFSHVYSTSRTTLAERWVNDILADREDWENVKLLLYQEAELREISIAELLEEILAEDAASSGIDLSRVDLSILMQSEIPTASPEHPEV